MKTTLKIFIYLLAATFMMVSCDEDGIEPLSGKYTPPGDYDLTTLDSQSRVKEESLYIFSINLKDAESNSLTMKFVASDYILPASDFTPSETAVKKTYLTGSEGSTFNGQQIASGTLTVALQDSNYTMNGILYLDDESVEIDQDYRNLFRPLQNDPRFPSFMEEMQRRYRENLERFSVKGRIILEN